MPIPPDTSPHLHRSVNGCIACGGYDLERQTQIISGFLADRAWGGPPELTELICCRSCGFRFFERGLSDSEAKRFYRDYRGPQYLRQRQRWEPFYTKSRHAGVLAWASTPQRLDNLRSALRIAGAPSQFNSALDHGGGRGDMLSAVTALRKAVYDPSGAPVLKGIESFRQDSALPGDWSLILCCQVLEHISDPSALLRHLSTLLADAGWLYVEVPFETWRSGAHNGALRRAWLSSLRRLAPLLITLDMASAAARIHLGRIPPGGFVSMREHLNFFSLESLRALLRLNGFTINAAGIDPGGQAYAVARKSITAPSG